MGDKNRESPAQSLNPHDFCAALIHTMLCVSPRVCKFVTAAGRVCVQGTGNTKPASDVSANRACSLTLHLLAAHWTTTTHK